MLETIAYAGWWFRELIHIVIWVLCVGWPEVARNLDNWNLRAVGWRREEEEYETD